MKLEYSLVLLAHFLFFAMYATDRCVFFSEGWLQESGLCQLLSIPRFGELEVEPITLIEGIESMQSPSDFLRAIGNGYQHETKGPYDMNGNELKTEKSSSRREYVTIRVVVTGYEHLRCRGELSAVFLNGMLQHVEFYPDNASEYLDHLKDNYGVGIMSGNHAQEHLRVSHTRLVDEGRIVVVWEDTRFEMWQDFWLKRWNL